MRFFYFLSTNFNLLLSQDNIQLKQCLFIGTSLNGCWRTFFNQWVDDKLRYFTRLHLSSVLIFFSPFYHCQLVWTLLSDLGTELVFLQHRCENSLHFLFVIPSLVKIKVTYVRTIFILTRSLSLSTYSLQT